MPPPPTLAQPEATVYPKQMALSATIYNFLIDLSDVDRGVYETLDLRVAREPSEAVEYMLLRVLAYCLEYGEGIELTRGVAAGNEPAIYLRDRTGQITAWIEVGLPDAARLHRGSKLAGRAAVYTHRDVTQLLAQYAGKKIHRAAEIPIYAIERRLLEQAAQWLERRTSLVISVTERQLYLSIGEHTLSTQVVEYEIA
ncbi:MAG: YaeQ family protein [Caldilineaceae bacterium]